MGDYGTKDLVPKDSREPPNQSSSVKIKCCASKNTPPAVSDGQNNDQEDFNSNDLGEENTQFSKPASEESLSTFHSLRSDSTRNCKLPFMNGLCSAESKKDEYDIALEEIQKMKIDEEQRRRSKLKKQKRRRRKKEGRRRRERTQKYVIDLEDFKNQLVNGYLMKKHGRDGSSKLMVLRCSPCFTELQWVLPPTMQGCLPSRGDSQKVSAKHRVKLVTIREVRAGNEADRDNPEFLGTEVLRKRMDDTLKERALSLVWSERTLDLEFSDPATCTHVYHGLRELITWAQSSEQSSPEDGNGSVFLMGPFRSDIGR